MKWQPIEACENVGVPIPKETENFFDGIKPGDRPGQEVSLGDAIKKWSDDSREGYELDIFKLPSNLKIIRFFNSW